jgi:Rieske Fe-S protein
MADATQTEPRRVWLLRSLETAISVTAVAVFYPVFRFLRPRRATVSGAQEMTAPFKAKDVLTTQDNPFNFGGRPCLVVLTPEGARRLAQGERLLPDDVHAFDAICTHLACTVEHRADKGDIFCNCHEGIFDLNGRNVSGPPPRPLTSYKVILRGEPGAEEIIVSREA